jgi:exodeoxyribonuclease-1
MSTRQTFFWYDLETSGINPRQDRVMQFAGQRTTLDLEPVGEPVNVLIKLTEDALPSPDAILITGITPQQTVTDGLTEVEFLRFFQDEVALPGTIFAGFNSVRFDDEFMRFLHYRNFYDAYAWQWQQGRGRWDLLDVVRMTRALRPEGIVWPEVDGVASNRLELLTRANDIDHHNAHDALADVQACIAVAKLIKTKQPKLFDWLLETRDKKKVAALADKNEPFVYTSGKYSSEHDKTTVAIKLAPHPGKQGSLVFDLRHDAGEFAELSSSQLADRWQWTRDKEAPPRLPVKTMQYNRCPAVAPLGVLDEASQKRIHLSLKKVQANLARLREYPDFADKVLQALSLLDKEQMGRHQKQPTNAEGQLYEGFISPADATVMGVVRAAEPVEISQIGSEFTDPRLRTMLPLYKARNYAKYLSDEERSTWEAYRYEMLMAGGTRSRLAQFMHRLSELSVAVQDAEKRFLLEELQLYAESIMPVQDA